MSKITFDQLVHRKNSYYHKRPALYLGAPIGCSEYVESFVHDQVDQWSSELEVLTDFAKSQPQAAYSVLTKGLSSNWSYVTRTTPFISHLLQPVEYVIRQKLVPTLTD